MTAYFLDTYALIEVVKGSPAYTKYAKVEGYTSLLNLYEFYFLLLRSHGEAVAKEKFDLFKQVRIEIRDAHIFLAASFKLMHNKLDISYADALGYAIAEAEGLHFLTGDN